MIASALLLEMFSERFQAKNFKQFEQVQFFLLTLGYRNHKSCKILPKFFPTFHFLQESYKLVQESQILQICYNVEHFLEYSDNIFAKIAFLR